MEPVNLLENGNLQQKRKFSCCQVAFCLLMLVLIMNSALVSVVFCFLHHKQALGPCWAHGFLKDYRTSNTQDPLRWELNIENCNEIVQKDGDQYLTIKQRGNYFIYAQINRKSIMNVSFTLMLYREPNILLNKAVGPNKGDEKGMLNFGRPFLLQKGDKLYCEGNFNLKDIVPGNQTYWGLYKM